jgi:hypothetical protein
MGIAVPEDGMSPFTLASMAPFDRQTRRHICTHGGLLV